MAAENSSIEPRGDGVERILARAQGLCYATFTLVQDVLHLIHPAAPAATQTLQLVLGGVHQPLASFFAGKLPLWKSMKDLLNASPDNRVVAANVYSWHGPSLEICRARKFALNPF